jgi:hypothetical protein
MLRRRSETGTIRLLGRLSDQHNAHSSAPGPAAGARASAPAYSDQGLARAAIPTHGLPDRERLDGDRVVAMAGGILPRAREVGSVPAEWYPRPS